MSKVRNNIGSKSRKDDITLNLKDQCPRTKLHRIEKAKVRNDIGTKCLKVEMTYGKLSQGRCNIGEKRCEDRHDINRKVRELNNLGQKFLNSQ